MAVYSLSPLTRLIVLEIRRETQEELEVSRYLTTVSSIIEYNVRRRTFLIARLRALPFSPNKEVAIHNTIMLQQRDIARVQHIMHMLMEINNQIQANHELEDLITFM